LVICDFLHLRKMISNYHLRKMNLHRMIRHLMIHHYMMIRHQRNVKFRLHWIRMICSLVKNQSCVMDWNNGECCLKGKQIFSAHY
jgi:hypothetical protein